MAYMNQYYYLMETAFHNKTSRSLEYKIALCDSSMVPLAVLPFQLPKDLENKNQYFSPQVSRVNSTMYAITISARTKGNSIMSEWNEYESHGETAPSYLYFIDFGEAAKVTG